MYIAFKTNELGRKIYAKISGVNHFGPSPNSTLDYYGEQASEIIRERLSDDLPIMICRFGQGEISFALRYYFMRKKHPLIVKSLKYIFGKSTVFWPTADWPPPGTLGYESVPSHIYDDYCELILRCIPNIDILGSWLKEEQFFSKFLIKSKKIRLLDLEPYIHINPWTKALEGKKILVIHPFEKSILNQYAKRDKLFINNEVLPEFELKTIKAPFWLYGDNSGLNSWFDVYDCIRNNICKIDFDIAIIGCASWGLPIADFVKSLGKKAIHLGGATQLLFGIKGKRWDDREYISKLYNEHWVRPLPSETPANYLTIEGGCYW